MANQEHLEILKQGTAVWNAWREQHPEIQPDLYEADLSRADLSGVNLYRADLSGAILVRTNLTEAILTECRIYGIAAWDIELTGASQNSLIITPEDQPTITVDNLKIAQFLYL